MSFSEWWDSCTVGRSVTFSNNKNVLRSFPLGMYETLPILLVLNFQIELVKIYLISNNVSNLKNQFTLP